MRKQMITVALVGALGVGGAASALTPALAADTPAATAVTDRVTSLKDALKSLVTDGTLTQAQADKVATTLAERLPRGGRGHHGPKAGRLTPEAVAKVLGISVEELRTAHESGKTLAQIAQEKGTSKADLVSRLVTAAKAQLAADVKAGTITQAQADAISENLTERVTARVDRVHGEGGRGRHGGFARTPPAGESTAPSASPSSTA